MRTVRPVRTLSVVVYFLAATLGTGLFVVDPVGPLFLVSLFAVIFCLGHAVQTGNLDQLGWATMWLWAAVLVLSGGGLTVETVLVGGKLPPMAGMPLARVLGTGTLIAVLGVSYRRAIQNTAGNDDGRTSPA